LPSGKAALRIKVPGTPESVGMMVE
jgi:hypothetical protein